MNKYKINSMSGVLRVNNLSSPFLFILSANKESFSAKGLLNSLLIVSVYPLPLATAILISPVDGLTSFTVIRGISLVLP